jgi:enoyl-CoA hydratase
MRLAGPDFTPVSPLLMSTPQQNIQVSMPALGVMQVVLNRPAKLNALSRALLIELAEAVDQAVADDATRCIVVTGSDKVFSAGADISEMSARGYAALVDKARMQAWETIERCPKPLIAAVRGIAYGGGHELALLADIIVASETARFAQPEINIGILPGDGATQRLLRIAGKSLTMQMVLTGEPIDAATALRAGLISEVVPADHVLPRAIELAAAIAQKAPISAALAKEAVLAAYETALTEGLRAERRAIRHAFTTEDQREGMAAFFEKRPPRFRGS